HSRHSYSTLSARQRSNAAEMSSAGRAARCQRGIVRAMRNDGRAADQLRPVKVTRHFTATPGGSVLWQQGNTIVWCTASVTPELPPWMKDDRPGGWITAEYVMLPASTPRRKE